jgi:hypothetical protein
MSVWAYIPALATTTIGMSVFWALNNGGGNGFRCMYNRSAGGTHQWQMQYYYTGSSATYIIYNGVLANKWYNLTNTMSSSGIHTFYINGVIVGTDATAGSAIIGQNIYSVTVGSGQQFGQFVGYVQDLRIYNTALSASQIYGIYQSQGIPPSTAMVPTTGGLPGPQYAWQFEGNTTDTITGLTGTTTGSVSYNSSGKYGQSLIMNGSSYVKYSTTLGYNLGTGGATFAMWFKLLAVPTGNFWVFGASGTSYGDRIYILVRTDAKIEYNFIDNTLAGKQLVSPSALVVGTWTHLTFTLFNGTMVMYVNGAQVATRSDAPMSGIVLDTAFSIAALAGGSANNINAEYDDFRIFNSALSSTQIRTIYNSGGNLYGANTVQPALFWSFNGTLQESVTGYKPIYPRGDTNPSGSSLTFTSGKYGQGLQFIPGTSYGFGLWDSISFGTLPLARTYFPYAGGMSVSFWYMPTSLATNGLLFSSSSFKSLTVYGQLDLIFISLNTSGGIQISGQSAGSGAFYGYQFGTVAVNNWVHIAFGVDTTNIYTYINGVLTNTRSQPAGWATTDITSSGYWMGGMSVGTQHFAAINGSITGIMNDLRVYSSLLSASQIYGIYQSQGIPPSTAMVPTTGGLPGPQYAWQFEGNTTDTITGLTGTTTGSVSYNSSGKYGQSLIMNGSSYVKYSTTLGYNLGTGGATFAMWFKLLAVPTGNFWVFGASGTSYGDRIYILVRTDAKIEYNFIDNTLAGKQLVSPSALVVGTWTHLTFTLFNGTMVMYVNGAQVATRSDAPMSGIVLDTAFSIAALAAGSGNNINAEYDDFRIYNTALSSTQIQTIYNSGGNLYGANLVQPTYMWPFNGSVIDVVQGLAFNKSNIAGVDTNNPSWPYYDSTGQRVGSSALLINNSLTPNSSNLLGINGGGFTCYFPFTCTYWVRINDLGAGGGNSQLVKFQSSPPIITNPFSGSISSVFTGGGSSTVNINFSLTRWLHIAVVVNLNQLQLYVNGVPGSVGTPASPYASGASFNDFKMTSQAYNGVVAGSCISAEFNDLRFYSNTALSTQQIQAIYQSGGASPMVIIN